MEEAFVWLMRLLALKEILQGETPRVQVVGHAGCGCGCGEDDLDDMNDLDDGRAYIWNRR